jgi:hypothetical protein
VTRVSGYRSRGPDSIPGATRPVGLEQGSLSLVSTIEDLLERKSSGSGLGNRDYGRSGMYRADYATPLYLHKLALTSPTSGGSSETEVNSKHHLPIALSWRNSLRYSLVKGCVSFVDGLDFVEKSEYVAFTAAFGNDTKIITCCFGDPKPMHPPMKRHVSRYCGIIVDWPTATCIASGMKNTKM